jgi:hypothetical protein
MMAKRNLIITIISSIFFVFSIVLVGVFAYKSYKKDIKAIGACWSPEKVYVESYEVNGAKECPEITWDKKNIPLAVRISTAYTQPNESEESVLYAIKFVNLSLGFKVLERTNRRFGSITVTVGTPYDNSWGGPGGRTTHYHDANDRQYAIIESCHIGDVSTLNAVLIHEFLHALGAPHENFQGSVMYYNQKTNLHGVSLKQLWISDNTRRLLRDKYSPR